MFINYTDYDQAEGYHQAPLRERIAQERADYEARERARLARNAARDAEQASWPMPPCRWTVLDDRLVRNPEEVHA